jgi:hypothetical protein
MMFVLVLVCHIGEPQCDTKHAIAYQAYALPPGFSVCGLPGMLPIQSDTLRPREGEEVHIKCKIGNR